MKRALTALLMAALLAGGTQLVFAGSQTEPAKKAAGEPGAIMVEAVSLTAQVTAIDAAKRTVTLEMDGKTKTITCGPEVRNFNQIKVGDQVSMTFVESLAVYIQKAGAPAGGAELATVTLAPKGAKPGVMVTKSIVLNAKIDAVNANKRTVTVTAPDGASKTFKVAKTVKGLKSLKKGDDVVVRFTEALAIVVTTPKK
jgi:hypothetical protein